MTTIDEKKTLEIERLELEVTKLLQTDFKLEDNKLLFTKDFRNFLESNFVF